MSLKFFSKKYIFLGVIMVVLCSIMYNTLLTGADIDYMDKSQSAENRATALLNQMTLDEKVGQMLQIERTSLNTSDITTYYIGSLLSGGGSVPSQNNKDGWTKMINDYQNAAKSTRLKIPLIYGVDAVHGHNSVYGATIFPHNIGLGATRDITLVKNIGQATAEEVRATGIHWSFSPCISVPQNIRWGRTYEGFSENTKLVSDLGVAYVEGFQGSKLNPIACIKHFIGDGATQDGINEGNCTMSETEIREKLLPPYIESIKAGARSVMVSFNSIDGVKCHASNKYITGLLKDELGFNGIVISDWDGIFQISNDNKTSIKTSLNAGIDMFMLSKNWKEFITTTKQLVNNNEVPLARIDDAVKRILQVKFEMGMFDNTIVPDGDIGTTANRNLAREAVRKSLVLLKNENNIIEKLKTMDKIFVAGKSADNIGNQCGGWTISWQGNSGNITHGTTILNGIKSAVGNTKTVTYNINGTGAQGHDVAIVCIGETPYAETFGDRTDLPLDSNDLSTLSNVQNANIPTIVILVSGRPMIITDQISNWDALIAAWLPGSEGSGIADLLFGDYDFTGQLPYTWPKSINQLHTNPLFEYGYGLNKKTQPSPDISSSIVPSSPLTVSPSPSPSPSIIPSSSAPATTSPQLNNSISVEYITVNDWGSGSTVSITIKNNGSSTINNWKLEFSFDGNQKITNLWNGSYTQSGNDVTISNASWNGNIPANNSITIGFNISYSGSNPKPSKGSINGTLINFKE